jgi:hypothetical protein
MAFEGHHPDGSGVQRHSAGAYYPLVYFQVGHRHGVLLPGGEKLLFDTRHETMAALELLTEVRDSPEAAVREAEAIACGVRSGRAGEAAAILRQFAAQGPNDRVLGLLRAGLHLQVRYAQRAEPPRSPPAFARLAAAWVGLAPSK